MCWVLGYVVLVLCGYGLTRFVDAVWAMHGERIGKAMAWLNG